MKKLFFTLATVVLFCAAPASAQTSSGQPDTWLGGWKYAFSPEGRAQWYPEFTLRTSCELFGNGIMGNIGMCVDEKHTLGIAVQDFHQSYRDYSRDFWGEYYTTGISLFKRRYFFARYRVSLYSDFNIGVGIVRKTEYNSPGNMDEYPYRRGDVVPIMGWNPGVRIRFFRNFQVFLGPTFSINNAFGVHLGFGF